MSQRRNSFAHLTATRHNFGYIPIILAMALAIYWASNAWALDDIQGGSCCDSHAPASEFEAYYYSRSVDLACFGEHYFSFDYPLRPTIAVEIDGTGYRMLFDTGTNCCISLCGSAADPPFESKSYEDQDRLAVLEAKRLKSGGRSLEYRSCASLRIGDFRLRDVPFRLYRLDDGRSAETDDAGFDGAVAPVMFHEYVIEVDNAGCRIEMHDHQSFRPPAECLVLPVLVLPRGMFIPMNLRNSTYWFHLDTGFSGGVGLLAELTADGNLFRPDGGFDSFLTWGRESGYPSGTLESLTVYPYQALTWAGSRPLVLKDIPAVSYPDVYPELSQYGIGGVIGSGLMQHFHYWLDLNANRLYLLPRKDSAFFRAD